MAREDVLVEMDEELDYRWVTCFGKHYPFWGCFLPTEFEDMSEIEAIVRKDDFFDSETMYQAFKERQNANR